MPVVTIELVVADSGASLAPTLAQSLADAVGRAFHSSPGQTWVRLRTLGRHDYAENDSLLDVRELPVFVTVLKRQPPVNTELQAEVDWLTQSIGEVLGRPATCVHIEYAASPVGRVAFGGKLVR